MSRFGGLSEERPSVFKTPNKLGTHLSTQCSGDERVKTRGSMRAIKLPISPVVWLPPSLILFQDFKPLKGGKDFRKTPVPAQRFETFAIDLFGSLPETKDGKRWILIIEDCTTKWVELFALPSATVKECAITLIEEVLLRYGIPRRLISDYGTQFVSAVMQQICSLLNIHQSLIPVYHPQANPVERKNRDLKPRLAILVQDKHDCCITSAEQRCARKKCKTNATPRRFYLILTQRSPPSSYEIASLDNPEEPLGVYHTSALTPCNNDKVKPLIPLRKRGRPPKVPQTPGSSSGRRRNQRGRM
ncbi:transposon Tf2-11 polyprotein [Trichonephila clavipes]|nr:transposon Tf2-11 polyprotein [Trichonephila clavipes]